MWELKLRLFTNTDRRTTTPKQPSPSDTAMNAQDLEQLRIQDGSSLQTTSSGSSFVLDSEKSQPQSTLDSQPSGDASQKTARELEDEADEAKYGKVSQHR